MVNNIKNIVFFRNDDVGEIDKTIVLLMALFEKYDIPLSLQVVPKNITKEFVDYYNSLGKKQLFDIGQHGFDHLPVMNNGKNEGEFGKSKKLEEKRESIEKGWKIIEEKFGKQSVKIFTPPWGTMDQETYKILKLYGYDAVSALNRGVDSNPLVNIASFLGDPLKFKKHGMLDLSISINNMRDFQKRIPKTVDELTTDFERFSSVTKYIGVMLHDKLMDDDAFGAIGRFIEYLKKNDVKIMSMCQIVQIEKHGQK